MFPKSEIFKNSDCVRRSLPIGRILLKSQNKRYHSAHLMVWVGHHDHSLRTIMPDSSARALYVNTKSHAQSDFVTITNAVGVASGIHGRHVPRKSYPIPNGPKKWKVSVTSLKSQNKPCGKVLSRRPIRLIRSKIIFHERNVRPAVIASICDFFMSSIWILS